MTRNVFGAWLAKGTTPGAYRPMLCGTKTTERRGPDDFRVVCATCGAGGSHRYLTHAKASDAAIRASSRACRACVAS